MTFIMTSIDNRIIPLDIASQTKIKSSVQILSLNNVVIELVKNSLDAQATDIKVVLNYAHRCCSVLDNGHGIPAREFRKDGRLAQPYCTSKNAQTDFTYGRHGRYLSALAGVALVAIVSRTEKDRSANVLWCDVSGRLRNESDVPGALDTKAGTRVKVYNLFSNLPVRHKHLADRFSNHIEVQKEFDRLKHDLCGLKIAYKKPFELDVEHSDPFLRYHYKPASYQHRNLSNLKMANDLETVLSILRQSGYVGKARSREWKTITAHADELTIQGFISLEPMPHKLVQFIAVNHEPVTILDQPELFRIINAMFNSSTFATHSNTSEAFTSLQAASESRNIRYQPRFAQSRGIDRWPMFVIWVETTQSPCHEQLGALYPSDRTEKLNNRIKSVLETACAEFLFTYGFINSQSWTRGITQHSERTLLNAEGGKIPSAAESEELQAFQYWSRTRPSRQAVVDNILTGLPFRENRRTDVPLRLAPSTAQETVQGFHIGSGTETHVQDIAVKHSSLENSDLSDQTIQWRNPQTGCTLSIDSRTGMVLPDAPQEMYLGANCDDNQTNKQKSSTPSTTLRKRKRALSLTQVAQNAARYSTCWSGLNDLPIRSIALFDGSSHVPVEQMSTHNNRCNRFWDHLESDSNSKAAEFPPFDLSTISRTLLQQAKVVSQVDKKFVLATISYNTASNAQQFGGCQLILIDQHAADERSKVEKLLSSVLEGDAVVLTDPLLFEVSANEVKQLGELQQHFAQWHIVYDFIPCQSRGALSDQDFTETISTQIRVTSLPAAVAERCRLNPKLVIDLIREEVWSDERYRPSQTIGFSKQPQQRFENITQSSVSVNDKTPMRVSDMPRRLLDLVNSRACRSAIMFNDELSHSQCENLVSQLSLCTLPFQCAHGRPSMVLISDLSNLTDHDSLAFNYEATTLTRPKVNRNPTGLKRGHEQTETTPMQPGLLHHPCLNTIDRNDVPTFGQAYLAWINTNAEPRVSR